MPEEKATLSKFIAISKKASGVIMILDRGLCANRKRMVSLFVNAHPIAGCECTIRLSKTNDNIYPVIYPAAIDQGLSMSHSRPGSLRE